MLGHRHKHKQREKNIVFFLNNTPLQQPPLYQEQNRAQNTPKGRTEEIEMVISPKLVWWRKKKTKQKKVSKALFAQNPKDLCLFWHTAMFGGE